jgi:hypothetical protein
MIACGDRWAENLLSLDMARPRIRAPAAVAVWLLCVVLTCLAVDSPHCDRCDGPDVVFSSSPTQVSHQQTVPPDTCNGICCRCGFHALPPPFSALALHDRVTPAAHPEPPSPLSACACRSSALRVCLSPQSPTLRASARTYELTNHTGDNRAPLWPHAHRSVPIPDFLIGCICLDIYSSAARSYPPSRKR